MRTDSRIHSARSTAEQVATLDGFSTASALADGISLFELTRLDCIEVRTRNSVYCIDILDPLRGHALVSGGAFFPVPREAVINGASLGGSMLKRGVVLVGFQFELLAGGERIVTSRVRQIRINPAGRTPGPF